ncbi:vWA domain-containing protein [Metabacillus arenae]|uniref:VWFA domain-containing protein n=1 Tax=Metabacillus arenae TaxID=2771434 RepID=A0A926RVL9_9BACI|nr:hypothetical protein [Metabacillus arenae]MBD1379006.1 hypothetical protein [Metabacillus arenae]
MKFIKFNDSQIDSFLFMELSDLVKTLTKSESVEVEYSVHSYYNPLDRKIYLSHFWDHRTPENTEDGLKSDVFLRSIGSYYNSDFNTIQSYLSKVRSLKVNSFAKQLFMLVEDIRLEEVCKKERPGTKRIFDNRRQMLRKHFRTQLTINLERSIHTDALFCALFLKLTTQSPLEEIPDISNSINLTYSFLENQLIKVFDSNSTDENVKITLEIAEVMDEVLEKDMLNTYFFLPDIDYHLIEEGLTFDDLKRTSKLDHDDTLADQKKGDEDINEEKMPTWHRETNAPSKSFLQFDLEHGAKTDLLGEGVREGDDGDQALGVVQGSSKQSSNHDFSKMEAMESIESEAKEGGSEQFGKENRFAYPVFKKPQPPAKGEIEQYSQHRKEIAVYQKKLKQMIQKTLEHKKNLPRTDLHVGRLNKKLLRVLTDDNPRLFYKKQSPSSQIDAVFTLLVDCSASMFDKMEQTKLGITLFHEALKSVQVVHQVIGFWEDTNGATETKQPNYFYPVVPFTTSLIRSSGPEIMQLLPEEDNRDGYAIRHMTKQLRERSEKQKFLLVFSDGEPAAMNYEQNGIVDTHEAVVSARKQGIEVINIFLANENIDECQVKTIQNIYGKYSILVERIEELPEVLFPLLKKLLQKSIY